MRKRRITIKPGPGATINGLPGSGKFYRSNSVIVTGDFDFEVEDLDNYVQVEIINNGGRRYTYRDPSGQLAAGMLVEIPTVYGTTIGKVVALGHGGYSGDIKDVAAVIRKEALV